MVLNHHNYDYLPFLNRYLTVFLLFLRVHMGSLTISEHWSTISGPPEPPQIFVLRLFNDAVAQVLCHWALLWMLQGARPWSTRWWAHAWIGLVVCSWSMVVSNGRGSRISGSRSRNNSNNDQQHGWFLLVDPLIDPLVPAYWCLTIMIGDAWGLRPLLAGIRSPRRSACQVDTVHRRWAIP